MNKVSVVITTYNRTKYLRESVASIRAQSIGEVDIIIVDDASTDGRLEALRGDPLFSDVTFLRTPENLGLGGARNIGIRAAKGEYLVLHDDDDILAPTLIRTALDIMGRDPAIGLFCCDAVMINAEGAVLYRGRTFHEINGEIKRYPIRSGIRSFEEIFLFSTIGIGLVVRRHVFDRAPYPPARNVGDYEFQLRVAATGHKVYYLHEPLASYRMHEENASGSRWMVRTCERKVACLQDVSDDYGVLEKLGWRARRRMADARMELAVAYAKTGRYRDAIWMLGRSVSDDPRQLVDVARLAWRWLAKRVSARLGQD